MVTLEFLENPVAVLLVSNGLAWLTPSYTYIVADTARTDPDLVITTSAVPSEGLTR